MQHRAPATQQAPAAQAPKLVPSNATLTKSFTQIDFMMVPEKMVF
jgi:hypothetical protein